MHRHDNEHVDVESMRPKASRLDEREESRLWRAGADGRIDVVGAHGMLGLQRAVGNKGVGALADEERSPVLDVVSSGGGSALDTPIREDMEARLNRDFSDVRVHTGDAAHRSASAVNAHAYTVGSNVVFQRGRYDPASTEGRTMLAHELTHVIQQRNGPVDGTPTGGGVRVSDPSDRFEREAAATAERVMSAPAVGTTSAPGSSASTPVQRDADEDEPVQGAFVQRAAEEEDEEPVQGAFVQREAPEEDEETVG